MSPIEKWVMSQSKRHHLPKVYLRELLEKQNYKCAFSDIDLDFRFGCFEYATIDHSMPGMDCEGHTVVCYALNNMKGSMNLSCFQAMQRTIEWKCLMDELRVGDAEERYDILRTYSYRGNHDNS
jgi:hypothetical protein